MAQTKIKAGLFEGIIGNGTDGYFLMSNGDGTMTWSSIIVNPTITSLAYPGSVTAADPAGGETITVTGTGFKPGATVTVGGTAAPAVSYVSETQITFTTPAKAAGDYDIVVTNTDTGSATYINGISYNGIPSWTTAAGSLGTFASSETISTITLQATEPDAGTITFNITNGALPTGLSLTGANIDGTTSLETAETLYTFTVTATDNESQTTPRVFTITVKKQFIATENFTINTYTGNGSTQSIEGKIGTAASFNGSSSKIQLPQTYGAEGETFSYSFWFNTSTNAANNSDEYIISKRNGNNTFHIRIETNGEIALNNWAGSAGSAYNVFSTNSYTDGNWHHFVFTYDGNATTKSICYIDGNRDTSMDWTYNLGTQSISNGNVIGQIDLGGRAYTGKLDQVRVFGKALSSSEVTTLYGESNTSTTKSTTDIFSDSSGVALYEFEEGTKDTGGVSGKFGSGFLSFGESGDQYIDLPDALSRNQSQTLSAWIYPVTQSSDRGTAIKLSEDDNMVISYNTSGQFEIAGVRDSSDTYASFTNVTKSAGQWYHIVIARNASQIKLYIDNSLIETISWSGNLYSVGGQPYGNRIGQNNLASQSFTRKFAGRVDDVRVYSDELTSTEVGYIYNNTTASIPTDNLLAYYKLDGDANDSGRFGSGPIDAGQSAVFNNTNSYITVSSSACVTGNGARSATVWINKDTVAGFVDGIINYGSNSTSQKWTWALNGNNIELRGYSNDFSFDASSYNIYDGNWHHLAVTFSGSVLKFYIDGSEATSSSRSYNTASGTLEIGKEGSNYFEGKMDDLRFYSDELTASEIEYIVKNDIQNIPTDNLIFHYKLDGNGNDETTNYNATSVNNITYSDPAEFPTHNGTPTNVSYGYDGTPTNVSFVGTSFQPDLVWIKARGHSISHYLFDSVRGQNARGYHFMIQSNSTDAESERNTTAFESTYGGLTSLDTNGFTLEHGTDTSDFPFNGDGSTYVAWNWKAGGTAVSNTDGSITSSVSANQDAGFSIVKYTGENAARTVGHGLSSAPEMVIVKNIDGSRNWMVWHKDLSASSYLYLNLTNSEDTDTRTNGGQPRPFGPFSSNTFGVNIDNETGYTDDYVAYCFHSVDGYQKIGSYTGTGALGNVINVGFKPRFLLWKKTNGAVGWFILDGIRNTSDVWSLRIEAHNANSEAGPDSYTVSVSDTGFEMTGSFASWTGSNELNSTYIYLAIA